MPHPKAEKVSAILALQPPSTVKQLRRVLGIIQYYRDIWEKRTDLLAPLTDLVGECGTTKSTKKKGMKKSMKAEKRELFESTLGNLGSAKDLREHFTDLEELAKLLPPES